MRKYFKRNHEYFTFLEKNKNNIIVKGVEFRKTYKKNKRKLTKIILIYDIIK